MALSQGADYILMDEPFAGNDIFNREDFYKVLLGLLEPSETVILSKEPLNEEILREAITKTGYTVGEITSEPYEKKGFFHFGRK